MTTYRYEEYCFSTRISVDDNDITEDKNAIKEANQKMFDAFNTKENATHLFAFLISYQGEYEPSEKCDQCGNYDTVVNLEL
jgi:hypothetical protein